MSAIRRNSLNSLEPHKPGSAGHLREIAAFRRAHTVTATCCDFRKLSDGTVRLVFTGEDRVQVDPAERRDVVTDAVLGQPDVSWRSYVVRVTPPQLRPAAGPDPLEGRFAVVATYPYWSHDCLAWEPLQRGWQRSVEERDGKLREGFEPHPEATEAQRSAMLRERVREEHRDLFTTRSRTRAAVLDHPVRPAGKRLTRHRPLRSHLLPHDICGITPAVYECFESLKREARIRALLEQTGKGTVFAEAVPLTAGGTFRFRTKNVAKELIDDSGHEQRSDLMRASILWALAGPAEGLYEETRNPRSIYREGTPVAALVEEIYLRVAYAMNLRLLGRTEKDGIISEGESDGPDALGLRVRSIVDQMEGFDAALGEVALEQALESVRSEDWRNGIALLEVLANHAWNSTVETDADSSLRELRRHGTPDVQRWAGWALDALTRARAGE